jgi:integrase
MAATEPECRRRLRAVLNDRDTGRLRTRPEQWTVGEWLTHWLGDLRGDDDLAESTRRDYESLIRTWLAPQVGGVRLDRVTDRHARKVQDAMKAAGRGASRRHHVHVVLDSALDAAVKAQVLGFNPIAHVDAPRVPHREVRPPDRADVEAIYREVRRDRLEARWLIALVHGLRQGEALGVEWEHVDLARQTLTVVQQLRRSRGVHRCGPSVDGGWPCGRRWASLCTDGTGGELTLRRVKTDRARRTIPLTGDIVALLKDFRRQQARERLMHGEAYQQWTVHGRDTDLVFRTPDGRPIEPRSDWQAWQDILARAGLAATRLHNARHAAAVGMIDSGVPMAQISDLMGHASQAFFLRTYGHLSAEGADTARDLLQTHHAQLREPRKRRDAAE